MHLRVINHLFKYSPSSNKVEDIIKMLDAGMNVARLNFSHGDHAVIFNL